MQQINFDEVVAKIVEANPRYHKEAYGFLREALEFTQKKLSKNQKRKSRDVSPSELLEGFREYTLEQFGPMSISVLNEWGISTCEEVGNLVFIMVENNLFSKTERDTADDFRKGYSFDAAFRKPFQPPSLQKVALPDAQSLENKL